MSNDYVETKAAWVVLGSNEENDFRVVFENIPLVHTPKFEGKAMTYVTVDKGMAYYGMYDSNGKRWSSRAGVINVKHNVDIVDIGAVVNGHLFAWAITREYAEYLLEKYKLPFHYELCPYTPNERMWTLVQNDTDAFVDRVLTDSKGLDCKVQRHFIYHGIQYFDVEYADERQDRLTFKDLMSGYKGLTHEEYRKELDKLTK